MRIWRETVMELKEAIQYALEGKAILFAGSGFSHGATNFRGEKFKTGIGLRNSLAKSCGIDAKEYSLSAVADFYTESSGHSENDLISFLIDEFTLGEIAPAHEIIMSIKWKRIYTTNYDLVIEEGAKLNKNPLFSVTLEDHLETYPKEQVCVHINGSIHNLTVDSLKNSFRLTDRSYDSETLVGKPWFDFMGRDFDAAKAIIVVGFSMQSDIDIRRIIASPNISNKTVFVSAPDLDALGKQALEKYAPVERIGVEGFSERIECQKKEFVPSTIAISNYTSFIHEHMVPLEKSTVRLEDLSSFYYTGFIQPCIMQKDAVGDYQYIAMRNAVNTFLRERYQYKVFLAVSNLGNGKTMFCHLVRNELRREDVHIFVFQRETVDTFDEIESICNNYRKDRIVVIIDDYYKYLNVLQQFGTFGNLSKITFLLTSRQSKISTNYRRLTNNLRILDSDVKPLKLNHLTNQEIQSLATVLYSNNLCANEKGIDSQDDAVEFIRFNCKSRISDVIIKLFDSSYIREQLLSLYTRTLQEQDQAFGELSVASLASEVLNLHLSTDDITRLLNIDFVKLKLSDSELINELFDAESGELKVKSSIIARKILQDIIPLESLLRVLKQILIVANNLYTSDQRYEELMKAIVSHANFLYWIQKTEYVSLVKNFYDDLRLLAYFSTRNPFYWEQFASVCIDAKDFVTAKLCLENAFKEAEKIPGFVPFQVETVYARYLVEQLIYDITLGFVAPDMIVSTLMDASKRLIKHYTHPDDEHYHVFRLFNKIVCIFREHLSGMSNRDTLIFLEQMVHFRRLLADYQQESESIYFSDVANWLKNLDETIELSKKHTKK